MYRSDVEYCVIEVAPLRGTPSCSSCAEPKGLDTERTRSGRQSDLAMRGQCEQLMWARGVGQAHQDIAGVPRAHEFGETPSRQLAWAVEAQPGGEEGRAFNDVEVFFPRQNHKAHAVGGEEAPGAGAREEPRSYVERYQGSSESACCSENKERLCCKKSTVRVPAPSSSMRDPHGHTALARQEQESPDSTRQKPWQQPMGVVRRSPEPRLHSCSSRGPWVVRGTYCPDAPSRERTLHGRFQRLAHARVMGG